MWNSNPDNFWEYMQDAYPQLVAPAVDIASEASVTMYSAMGDLDFEPQPIDLPEDEQFRASARWAMSRGNAITGLKMLMGSTQRRIFESSRNTMMFNANREPGARWARHAHIDACPFCRMLTTRGFVYHSAAKAGSVSHYHDHCTCTVAVSRPGGREYQPPAHMSDWMAEYEAASRATNGSTAEILAYMKTNELPSRNLLVAGGKYDDEAYLKLSPEEKKKERARRRREAAKPKPPEPKPVVVPPKPAPKPPEPVKPKPVVKPKYDDEAYRNMSPQEKTKERARRRALLKKEGKVPEDKGKPLSAKQMYQAMLEEFDTKSAIAEKKVPKLSQPDDMTLARKGANINRTKTSTRSKSWNTNCQRVAPTYELRRRGYDVTAAARTPKNGIVDDDIARLFLPKEGRQRWWTTVPTMDDLDAELIKQPSGARGYIITEWKGGGAHIFNYEVVVDAGGARQVDWVEAQTNIKNAPWITEATYKGRMKDAAAGSMRGGFRTMRVDDLEFNFDRLEREKVYE